LQSLTCKCAESAEDDLGQEERERIVFLMQPGRKMKKRERSKNENGRGGSTN